jgi:hypothetical protein
MIDATIYLEPSDIAKRTDAELIGLLRWWQHEGDQIYKEIHERRQQYQVSSTFGVVYFARRSDGLIKIGFTTRPQQRYDRLAEQQGERLTILHEVETDTPFELEQVAHKVFAEFCVKGEWFNIPENIVQEIILGNDGNKI